jgi:hypothetical protein
MTPSSRSRRSGGGAGRPAVLLLALLLAPGSPAGGQEPPPSPPPPAAAAALPEALAEIERVEAVTESFADALNELADRLTAGDWSGAEPFFADEVRSRPFPGGPGATTLELKWLRQRTRSPEPKVLALPRQRFLEDLRAFLAPFAAVERVAFEVTGSTLRAANLDGTVALAVRGRNRQGQREWVQGEATVAARRGEDGAWRIASFVVDPLRSLTAERELFRDATDPAGLAAAPDLTLPESFTARQQWYPNGAAAADVDRDGLLDLFVTGPEGNHLYMNQGDGTFKDGAARAGLKTIAPDKPVFNPVFLDHDNDGDSDLFITSVHENVLLENRLVPDGRALFRNVSLGLPQAPEVQGWSVAAGDVNRDGRPDLYVVSYFSPLKGPFPATTVDDTTGGSPSLLLINRGEGTFSEEAKAWGVEGGRWAMGAQFADVDGDHDLDLYVANDYGGGNFLYLNEGNRFVDRASERGALQAAESMGVSFADYDNDGDLDLHVTNMSSAAATRALSRLGDSLRHRELLTRQWSGNALLQNQGDGTFREVSAQAGPFLADWAWGGGFIDIDNDGWEDLHTPNGFLTGRKKHDMRSLIFTRVIVAMQVADREETLRLATEGLRKMGQGARNEGYSFAGWSSDRVYLNRGDGRFLDISGVSGADSFPSDARASVYADFDNDGDLDIFVRATHGRSHYLFRNEVGQDHGFLRVALEGRASGRDAFGAVVRVKTPALTLTKSKHGNNGYLDQPDPRLLFGLGKSPAAEWIEVRWPSGLVQRLPGPFPAGSSLLVVEGEEKPRLVAEKRFPLADQPATGR